MSLRRSFFLSGFSQYAVLLLGFVKIAILSRVLNPAEIGAYTIFTVLIFLTLVFRELGSRDYIIAEKNLTEGSLDLCFTLLLVMGVVVASGFVLLAGPAEAFFNAPGLGRLLQIVAPTFVIQSLTAVEVSQLYRDMNFRALAVLQILPTLADLGVTLGLLYAGFGLVSVAWGVWAAIGLTSLLVVIWRRGRVFHRLRIDGILTILRFGLQSSGATLLNNIGSYAPALILGWGTNASTVGFFSRGQTLITFARQGVEVATRPVTQSWFAGNAGQDQTAAGQVFLRLVVVISGVAWPFYVFIFFHAATLIPFAFGPQWEQSVPVAQALAIGGMFSLYGVVGTSLLVGRGDVTRALRFNLISLGIRIVVLFTGLNFGLLGFAWAIACGHFLGFVVLGLVLRGSGILGLGGYLAATRQGAALAACCALVNYVLIRLVFHGAMLGVWEFLLVTAINAVIFMAILALLRHPLWAEVRRLI